jgi:hypothetical protein
VKLGGSTAEPRIRPDNETTLGAYGVFADDKSSTLGACFSSIPGPHESPQVPAILGLQTGALKGRYPLQPWALFAIDVAVGSDVTAYISDTANMEVDRLQNGQLQVWAGNGGFGPQGGILDGVSVLSNRLFVNTLSTNKLLIFNWKFGRSLDAHRNFRYA